MRSDFSLYSLSIKLREVFVLARQIITLRIARLDFFSDNMVITYIKQVMDQPGKVANPARDQVNKEHDFFSVSVRA